MGRWQQAGLDKESYVDTNNTITLPIPSADVTNPIGMLTESDVQRLLEFLSSKVNAKA